MYPFIVARARFSEERIDHSNRRMFFYFVKFPNLLSLTFVNGHSRNFSKWRGFCPKESLLC